MSYRCVKCAESHGPGNCPKENEDDPKCVNCQKKHPANYRGCQVAKSYLQKINFNKHAPSTLRHKNQNNTTSYVREGKTFSDMIKRGPVQHQQKKVQNTTTTTSKQEEQNSMYNSFNDEVSKLSKNKKLLSILF